MFTVEQTKKRIRPDPRKRAGSVKPLGGHKQMKFYKMNGGIKDSGEQSIINCRTGDYATITHKRIYLDISSDIKVYICTILCEHYFEEGFQFVVKSEDNTASSYVCDYATGARIIKNNIAPLLYGKMTAEQLGAILNEMQYNYAHKIRRRRTEGKQ